MNNIIIASGPVIVENKKVLLSQHGDTEFWKFCGGRIKDADENLAETARRRAKEELGIETEILDEDPFVFFTRKDNIDVILVHFLAKRIGEVKPGDDIRKWDWIPLEKLEKEKLGPNIIPTLKYFGFIS